MKKIILSAAVVLSFIFFTYTQQIGDKDDEGVVKLPEILQPNKKNPQAPGTVDINYRDGEYEGPVVDAYYGNVQVKAVIEGGKLTEVIFLDYPHSRQTSERVNQQALPYLIEEALLAQHAEVDIVTGATQTSLAFKKSLKVALEEATR